MNFKDLDFNKILEYEKISIIKNSEFGYPISIKIKIKSIELKDFAQYKDCISIIGIPEKKRKPYMYILKPNDSFVIVKGHIDVTDSSVLLSNSDGIRVLDMGRCFDPKSFSKAIENIPLERIILINKKEDYAEI